MNSTLLRFIIIKPSKQYTNGNCDIIGVVIFLTPSSEFPDCVLVVCIPDKLAFCCFKQRYACYIGNIHDKINKKFIMRIIINIRLSFVSHFPTEHKLSCCRDCSNMTERMRQRLITRQLKMSGLST